jgi:hypothetical protein
VRRRRILALAAALVTVFLVFAVRQIVVGERAMARSDAALERGDLRAAIASGRQAAEALLPGSPYPARGHARLAQIARDAEARGDDALAGAAWRAARAAAVETRALFVSNDAHIAEANAGILRAAAREASPHGSGAGQGASGAPRLGADDIARTSGPTSWEVLVLACAVLALYAAWERFVAPRAL